MCKQTGVPVLRVDLLKKRFKTFVPAKMWLKETHEPKPRRMLGTSERLLGEARPSICDSAESTVERSTRIRAKACSYVEMC